MMDGMGGGASVPEFLLVVLWIVWGGLAFGAGYHAARLGPQAPRDESLTLLRRRLAAGEIDDEQDHRLVSAMEAR
jgi:uncharacterized membrane protein